jgi:hypothetical protein
VAGETAHPGSVSGAERLECERVSVLGASYENGITQSVVGELWLGPQRGADSGS